MDAVAGAIIDLLQSEEPPAGMINVVHPRPISWRETFEAVNKALSLDLPFIPFEDWVAQVESKSVNASPQTLESVVSIHTCYSDILLILI